jgi:hypothetical protein
VPVGWFILVSLVVGGLALLALAPYLSRGRTDTPDDGRRQRGALIVIVAALLVSATLVVNAVAVRRLDAREDDLRADFRAAGAARLEEIRSLMQRDGTQQEAFDALDSLTSAARLSLPGPNGEPEHPAVAFARSDWFWSSRCYLVTIDPGGDFAILRRGC